MAIAVGNRMFWRMQDFDFAQILTTFAQISPKFAQILPKFLPKKIAIGDAAAAPDPTALTMTE